MIYREQHVAELCVACRAAASVACRQCRAPLCFDHCHDDSMCAPCLAHGFEVENRFTRIVGSAIGVAAIPLWAFAFAFIKTGIGMTYVASFIVATLAGYLALPSLTRSMARLYLRATHSSGYLSPPIVPLALAASVPAEGDTTGRRRRRRRWRGLLQPPSTATLRNVGHGGIEY
jgi:hypothetical protein